MLKQYLDDLESRIDPQVEDDLWNQWVDFNDGRRTDEPFSPRRTRGSVSALKWPQVNVNDALEDKELMALRELTNASWYLELANGVPLDVRCNYGVGILPSIFGADVFVMPPEMGTTPTTRPLSPDALQAVIDGGIPDLTTGYGGKVLEMGQFYKDILAPYPKLSKYIRVYHPDLQGPMDVCELLWGSDIFTAAYMEPDKVKSLLEVVTETYIAFMKKWFELFPPSSDYSPHWRIVHKGQIMIRDDSAMNFSPDAYDEFMRPYNERLLDTFGGGAIHFCGRGDHYIENLSRTRGVFGVNMSQPHLNDMETILSHTVDKGIALLDLSPRATQPLLDAGRSFHGLVHCAS